MILQFIGEIQPELIEPGLEREDLISILKLMLRGELEGEVFEGLTISETIDKNSFVILEVFADHPLDADGSYGRKIDMGGVYVAFHFPAVRYSSFWISESFANKVQRRPAGFPPGIVLSFSWAAKR